MPSLDNIVEVADGDRLNSPILNIVPSQGIVIAII